MIRVITHPFFSKQPEQLLKMRKCEEIFEEQGVKTVDNEKTLNKNDLLAIIRKNKSRLWRTSVYHPEYWCSIRMFWDGNV